MKVLIVGGGAAGMMAAVHASDNGAEVTLVERNAFCGKKLRITGKGRCNVTNDCNLQEFLQHVPSNPRFLYSALHYLSTEDVRAFFESEGVPLKVERGRRVFPVSDRAEDIVRCLTEALRRRRVSVVQGRVSEVAVEDGAVKGCFLQDSDTLLEADRVILCTGGVSYPQTGSDGDGHRLAKVAGHTVTPLLPSLVPLVSKSKICPALQGLSLKNVSLSVIENASEKVVYEDFGEMMFTHFGMTGPMILSASAHLEGLCEGRYRAQINLKPALDEKTLDGRILSDFTKYQNKDFLNALGDLLPQKMIPVIVELSGISPHKKVNSVTKEERKTLCRLIRELTVSIDGFRPIREAIVTKGGVSVKDVNPKTMESKKISGLYFAGELLDVDAYTGGYNLQIAFSTGALAGASAARS